MTFILHSYIRCIFTISCTLPFNTWNSTYWETLRAYTTRTFTQGVSQDYIPCWILLTTTTTFYRHSLHTHTYNVVCNMHTAGATKAQGDPTGFHPRSLSQLLAFLRNHIHATDT